MSDTPVVAPALTDADKLAKAQALVELAKAKNVLRTIAGKLKLSYTPIIGQSLGYLLFATDFGASIKKCSIKIGGEWIDTTSMATPPMGTTAGVVANMEGLPSVYSKLELKLTIQHDFSVALPIMLAPYACSIQLGPTGDTVTYAGNASMTGYDYDAPLDGSEVQAEVEIHFSGDVTETLG